MSKLPSRLQPWWPWFKCAHRMLSVLLGVARRRLDPRPGTPRTASTSSRETARHDPEQVTVHPGGQAEHRQRSLPEPSPPAMFERTGLAVPATYALELQSGMVVGDYGATVTAAGVLDYETSGYFGLASWREHPVFLDGVRHCHDVAGTVLSLTTRGTATNYYHFLYDAVGRLGIVEEAMPGLQADAVVVPHQSGYQRQLLDLVGLPGTRIQPLPRTAIRAERLIVPSTPNQDLDAPRATVDWLRARLPAQPGQDTPQRLYLSRGAQPNSRRYVHETAIRPALDRLGFTVVDPGALSVQEQINLFAGAAAVVAPHGAGLANITFCRPGTRILELFASTYVHIGLWAIADAVGLDYRCLVGSGPIPSRMVGVLDDITIPADEVEAAIVDLLT